MRNRSHGQDHGWIHSDTSQALWNSREKTLRSWIFIPAGILVILVACFGVDTLFKHASVSFPASVACMLLLFAGLWLSELVVGANRTRRAVAVIDVPVSLMWCVLGACDRGLMWWTGWVVASLDQRPVYTDVCDAASEPLHQCGRGREDHRSVW